MKKIKLLCILLCLIISLNVAAVLTAYGSELINPDKENDVNYIVTDMTWDAANGMWVGTENFVRVARGSYYGILPGNGEDVGLVYKIVADGILTFNETNHMFWCSGGANSNGIGATVLYNNMIIMERQVVENGSAIDLLKGKSLNVNEGDEIIFLVDSNGGNEDDFAHLLISLTLSETGGDNITTSFQNDFSSTQGGNNWYYRTYKANVIPTPEYSLITPSEDTLSYTAEAMTFDAETGLYTTGIEGNYATFGLSQYNPASTEYYPALTVSGGEAVALRYTVSTTGTLYIGNNRLSLWCSGGNTCNGVCVTILVNDHILVDRTYIEDGVPAGDIADLAAILGKGVTVTAGDTFTVIVDPNGSPDYDRLITFLALMEINTSNRVTKSQSMTDIAPELNDSWEVLRVTGVDTGEIDVKCTDETLLQPSDRTVEYTPYDAKYEQYTEKDGISKMAFAGDNYCFIYKDSGTVGLMAAQEFSLGITYNIAHTGTMHFYMSDMFKGATYQGNYTAVTILLNDKVLVGRTLIESKNGYNFLRNKYIEVQSGDKLTFLFDANANNFYDGVNVNIKGYIKSDDREYKFDLFKEFSGEQFGDDGSDSMWDYFFFPFVDEMPDFGNVVVGEAEDTAMAEFTDKLILRDVSWKSYTHQFGSNWETDLLASEISVCPGNDWAVSYVLTFEKDGRAMIDPKSYAEIICDISNAEDGVKFIILKNDKEIVYDWTRLCSNEELHQPKVYIEVPVFSVKAGDTMRIIFDKNERSGYDTCLLELNVHFAEEGSDYTKTYSTRYDMDKDDAKDGYANSAWQVDKLQFSETEDTGEYSGHEASFFDEEDGGDGEGDGGDGEEELINNKTDKKGCGCGSGMPSVATLFFAVAIIGSFAVRKI